MAGSGVGRVASPLGWSSGMPPTVPTDGEQSVRFGRRLRSGGQPEQRDHRVHGDVIAQVRWWKTSRHVGTAGFQANVIPASVGVRLALWLLQRVQAATVFSQVF